ncbi:MAG: ADP-glyceromanno-heptose 6-epimerase [Verrucomicrobia bacterium]|nr:ADP-glyceromanno-heptose 6-epimerase [Verrucomicrobiota bacterium]MCF7708400.1 ADP-glyceromanno-heptose 6-epimerase [Verrucomicrobiota bacterium]
MRNILVTGGAGFIGSNLTLALQKRFPEAVITVVDDFRSGDFKNLRGFYGDIVAADISRLDWNRQFGEANFDAVFHMASITDTTEHDQFLQVHDNVEGFRALLNYAAVNLIPVVYASSAATYGMASGRMSESQPPRPANVYAFSKTHLDNLARIYNRMHPSWRIVGVRYFNVYGPREAHKKAAASMIYQLYSQMKAGRRPRVFIAGEQKRDFVYIRDVVDITIRAINAPDSAVYNCGSGHAFSFNEVIAAINEALGTHYEPDYFENPYAEFYQSHTEADLSITQKCLGYQPKYTPEAGIKEYISILESGDGFFDFIP